MSQLNLNMKIKIFGKEFLDINTKSTETISLDEAINYLLDGREGANELITVNNAYKKQVWVYACIKKRAENIARVPFKLYNGDKEIISGPAFQLFKFINPYLSSSMFWEGVETYKLFRGEAFVLINRNGKQIVSFDFLEPDKMKDYSANGELIGWKYTNERGNEIPYAPEEILQFKAFNPYNKFRGLSYLSPIKISLDTDNSGRKFNKYILENGVSPGGIIEADAQLTPEQVKDLRTQIERRHKGSENAGKTMLLPGGTKYKDLKISQKDANFMEQMNMTKTEIHAAFSVPLSMTGNTDEFNKSNMEEITKNFWCGTLIPEMENFATNLNTNFFDKNFKGVTGKFDYKEIPELQETYGVKLDKATKLFAMGFTANEINEKLELGFEDKPWRDKWWISFGLAPADQVAIGPEKAIDDPLEKALKNINAYEKELSLRNYRIWSKFVSGLTGLEKAYERKVSSWFFGLRKEVLNNLFDYVEDDKGYKLSKKEIDNISLFNKSNQLRELISISAPYISEAVEKGGQGALEDLGMRNIFNLQDQNTVDYLAKQKAYLSQIVDTAEANLSDVLKSGVGDGLTINEISDNIKSKMNVLSGRSKLIARTEITSAGNGGRFFAMLNNGIERIEWIQSFDAEVRTSPYNHAISETVEIGKEFSMGLKWAGDKSGSNSTAGNLCNCRCTIIGVINI